MSSNRDPDDYGPFRIFGNLYFIGTRAAGVHLIDTGEGLIVIDTQYPDLYTNMIEKVERLGFSLSDIKIILHTHGHVDHVGGTARLVRLTGAKTYIGELDYDMVTGRVNSSYAEEMNMATADFFEPDVLLNDGDVITLGNTTITALHTPGHTPGTMSYFLDVTDGERTLRSGIMGGSGMLSMRYEHLDKYGISDKWRIGFPEVIERLRLERVDVMMGNHNGDLDVRKRYEEMLATGRNTFLDPTAWGEHLDRTLLKYNELISTDKRGN